MNFHTLCITINTVEVKTLEEINETDSFQGTDESLLLKSIENFEFIFVLDLWNHFFNWLIVCHYIFKKK